MYYKCVASPSESFPILSPLFFPPHHFNDFAITQKVMWMCGCITFDSPSFYLGRARKAQRGTILLCYVDDSWSVLSVCLYDVRMWSGTLSRISWKCATQKFFLCFFFIFFFSISVECCWLSSTLCSSVYTYVLMVMQHICMLLMLMLTHSPLKPNMKLLILRLVFFLCCI